MKSSLDKLVKNLGNEDFSGIFSGKELVVKN